LALAAKRHRKKKKKQQRRKLCSGKEHLSTVVKKKHNTQHPYKTRRKNEKLQVFSWLIHFTAIPGSGFLYMGRETEPSLPSRAGASATSKLDNSQSSFAAWHGWLETPSNRERKEMLWLAVPPIHPASTHNDSFPVVDKQRNRSRPSLPGWYVRCVPAEWRATSW
jgi:hypothetical protein